MGQYVVLYGMGKDHDRSERNRLQTELQNFCDWVWQMDDAWVVETQRFPSDITDALLKVGAISQNDEFIILGLTGTGNYRNVMNGVMAEWLDTHVMRV